MITLNAIFNDNITTATGTATQEFASIIKEKLCKCVCQNQSLQPTFSVAYSLGSAVTKGITTFVPLNAIGTITFVPNGCSGCNTITQSFTESTMLIFSNSAATSAPSLSITQGLSNGMLADLTCTKGKSYEIATDVVVSAVYA